MIKGCDVSSHNGFIDAYKVAAAGIRFAYIRATHHVMDDGVYIECVPDTRFRRNWDTFREAEVVVGAYHYLECTYRDQAIESPLDAQIYEFCAQLPKALAPPGILPPMLDVEEGDPDPEDVLKFLAAIEKKTGLCPWIYTMVGWWNNSRLKDDERFLRFPLVAADWTPPLNLPGKWPDCIIWQTSAKGRVPGIVGDVDLEEMQADEDMFRLLARLDS